VCESCEALYAGLADEAKKFSDWLVLLQQLPSNSWDVSVCRYLSPVRLCLLALLMRPEPTAVGGWLRLLQHVLSNSWLLLSAGV
jgi:hypothetical protein